jgi:hypothetical protein
MLVGALGLRGIAAENKRAPRADVRERVSSQPLPPQSRVDAHDQRYTDAVSRKILVKPIDAHRPVFDG